jgi:hypothetical protein
VHRDSAMTIGGKRWYAKMVFIRFSVVSIAVLSHSSNVYSTMLVSRGPPSSLRKLDVRSRAESKSFYLPSLASFYKQETPRASREELEEIRQQGLAKMFNKQFTEYAEMSEKDKVAYDAALRDLEQRKANTSEFIFSGNSGGISPLDAMYLSQNQFKSESRKKERETMLLNQRHSHSDRGVGSYANDRTKPMVR